MSGRHPTLLTATMRLASWTKGGHLDWQYVFAEVHEGVEETSCGVLVAHPPLRNPRCAVCSSAADRVRNAARPWYAGSWQRIRREAKSRHPYWDICGRSDVPLEVDHVLPGLWLAECSSVSRLPRGEEFQILRPHARRRAPSA